MEKSFPALLDLEQLDQIQKFLSQLQARILLHKTPWQVVRFLKKVSIMWITDSKASVHMTGNKELFSSYDAPCSGTLQIADGSLCGSWKGYMKLSNMIMLHAPKLSCNLISIKKLIMDLNCSAKFLICTQGR